MERIFDNVKITSSFDVPETGGNLVSGETIGKHFGKIAKHMNDESVHHTVDNVLSDTSENPVQNKVIKIELNKKADKTVATTETDGLMSAEDKGKLDAFEITTTGGKLHNKNIITIDDVATQSANGLMSAADKKKLDEINSSGSGEDFSKYYQPFSDLFRLM